MTDDLIVCCDLCKKPLDTLLYVELWKWTLHPCCAETVKARLERFAPIIFGTTDGEFEAWLKQDEPGEWVRTKPKVEYDAEAG